MSVVPRKGNVPEADWNDWRWQLRKSIRTREELESWIRLTEEERQSLAQGGGRLRMAITPFWASLMDPDDPHCPIRMQAVPTTHEFRNTSIDLTDPCGEDGDMVAPGLVHRYPDRVLMLVTDVCAMYCRYCTRARIVGQPVKERMVGPGMLGPAFEYLRKNKKVRDVLISGGDPLMLSDERLEAVIRELKSIPHIEFVRIGTRIPVVMPQRVTPELCAMLKRYSPIWLSLHFSHPKELVPEVAAACNRLADAGIPLGSQTVLLKGINDSPRVMLKLMHGLLQMRVRPYYIYQCDLVFGTEHFRTSVQTGLRIMESLRGHTTGYAVPIYVIDAPGGGGKVPITPEYVLNKSRKGVIIRNFEGKVFMYPERQDQHPGILEPEEASRWMRVAGPVSGGRRVREAANAK